MKVVYLIQTHRNPEQIYRLARTLSIASPNAFVLISHNYSGCDLSSLSLHTLPNVEVISTKQRVMRGRFSLVQAYLDAIEWLFQQNINFDWLCNLSGQDYPIESLTSIEQFLADTAYDGFIEYFDALAVENNPWGIEEGSKRYLYQYYWVKDELTSFERRIISPVRVLVNRSQPLLRIVSTYGLGVGVRAKPSPFSQTFRCYGGSDFKTLSQRCVSYIYQFLQQRPELSHFYSRSCQPEESMIQTILVNSEQFNLCNDNKRFIRWSSSLNGHPDILSVKDFSEIANSNCHFARKFDTLEDEKILDLLDKRVIGEAFQS